MNEIITNGTEIKQRILSEINNARQSIYVAMAWFTDRDIAAALIETKNRNVIADVILSSNAQNETVKLMLKGANINVHAFETGDVRGTMHHKFWLIDNKISINGSYNYSYNASNNNVENIHVSDNFSIYTQLFTEFERLKHNIDNNIAVNTIIQVPDNSQSESTSNDIDTFFKQLHHLVYSSAQIITEEYKKKGYQTSKVSQGSVAIFSAEYNNLKEEIKVYSTEEGLGNKKNVMIANINHAFESTKTNLDSEKLDKISSAKKDYELVNRQITDKISGLKDEKFLFEVGNEITGEIGLLQINKEIEKNKLERRLLEQSFIVKKFWSVGTVFVLLGLSIFIFYLSVFFASAVYKVFFEGNLIRSSLETGITPKIPQLVDANAVIKIFRQEGALFGFIAALFFLIPIALSNLKMFGSDNKFINNLMFWIGLLIFDIVVSTIVAINTEEIKSLLIGKQSQLKIWEVIKLGEFWLIFLFGMFPLIITHYLLKYITTTYRKSKREIIDAEKNKKIKVLDEEMIELISQKEFTNSRIKEKDNGINENKNKILSMEIEINDHKNRIENKYAELQKQIKNLFDDFNSKIISGKIFTDVILNSVVSAYKAGFVEYLPEYYATDVVANKVLEIDQITNNN